MCPTTDIWCLALTYNSPPLETTVTVSCAVSPLSLSACQAQWATTRHQLPHTPLSHCGQGRGDSNAQSPCNYLPDWWWVVGHVRVVSHGGLQGAILAESHTLHYCPRSLSHSEVPWLSGSTTWYTLICIMFVDESTMYCTIFVFSVCVFHTAQWSVIVKFFLYNSLKLVLSQLEWTRHSVRPSPGQNLQIRLRLSKVRSSWGKT